MRKQKCNNKRLALPQPQGVWNTHSQQTRNTGLSWHTSTPSLKHALNHKWGKKESKVQLLSSTQITKNNAWMVCTVCMQRHSRPSEQGLKEHKKTVPKFQLMFCSKKRQTRTRKRHHKTISKPYSHNKPHSHNKPYSHNKPHSHNKQPQFNSLYLTCRQWVPASSDHSQLLPTFCN
jgi:hypothetical protein